MLTSFDPIEGHWWLPQSPNHMRFGRVLFDEEDSWRLVVTGGLQAPPGFGPGKAPALGPLDLAEAPVVHGRTSDGRDISLFACLHVQWSWPTEPTQEVWRFQSFTEGFTVVSPDALMTQIALRLSSLPEWAGLGRPAVRVGDTEVTIKATSREAGSALLKDSTVRLVFDFALSTGSTEASVNHGAAFVVHHSTGVTFIEAMNKYVLPLRDLLCFLSLGYVEIEAILGQPRPPDAASADLPMVTYRTQLQRPMKAQRIRRRHEMLAPLLGTWSVVPGAPRWMAEVEKRPTARYQPSAAP